ncbi:MAG: adenylyltransferase [Acidimicrobiaceae bacterium]|jgi:ATP adenylyltransferase|nr:adenylyltransferase [Acidimicrobiaceae bacterium]
MPEPGLDRLWAGWRSEYVAGATDRDAHADDPHADDPHADDPQANADTADDADAAGADGTARCVFCALAASTKAASETRVVWRGTHCFAVLNAYPYTSGHVLVMPLRHVSELEQLTLDETAELWAGVTTAVVALKTAYRPEGINLGANMGRAAGAGIPAHFHVHALPRWTGDTNFMTSVAEARVMPEPLDVTWQKLTAAWPSGA